MFKLFNSQKTFFQSQYSKRLLFYSEIIFDVHCEILVTKEYGEYHIYLAEQKAAYLEDLNI